MTTTTPLIPYTTMTVADFVPERAPNPSCCTTARLLCKDCARLALAADCACQSPPTTNTDELEILDLESERAACDVVLNQRETLEQELARRREYWGAPDPD